jgi:hypothetical protein
VCAISPYFTANNEVTRHYRHFIAEGRDDFEDDGSFSRERSSAKATNFANGVDEMFGYKLRYLDPRNMMAISIDNTAN